MTPKQVIDYFGSISEAVLNTCYSRQAYSKWQRQGYIPMESQWMIKHHYYDGTLRKPPLPLKISKPYCKGDL